MWRQPNRVQSRHTTPDAASGTLKITYFLGTIHAYHLNTSQLQHPAGTASIQVLGIIQDATKWPMVNDLGNDKLSIPGGTYSSGDTLMIPLTLKLGPSSADITGPQSVCVVVRW
jgi:hypothetical protein